MKINKQELYRLYMEWVDRMCDDFEDKASFDPQEIVNSIARIIESNPELIELPSEEQLIGQFMNWLLKHYSTATIDGMFCYVNALGEEVSIQYIIDDYRNSKKYETMNIEKIQINGHYVWVDKDAEIKLNDFITDGYKCWRWKDDCSLFGRSKVISASPELNLEGVTTHIEN